MLRVGQASEPARRQTTVKPPIPTTSTDRPLPYIDRLFTIPKLNYRILSVFWEQQLTPVNGRLREVLLYYKTIGAGPWSALIDDKDRVRPVCHSSGEKSAVSMSLGGKGVEQSVLDAVEAVLVVMTAAGNDNARACFITPSAAPNAITVGVSDLSNASASISNWVSM